VDKICRVCHQQKPLSEFYTDAKSHDGLTTLCKDCTKEASRQYRASPRGRAMRKLRRYKDKQKIRARDAVSNAIKRGELPKAQTCQCVHCGRTASVYHHHKGYRKEHFLDVEPVCDSCHQTVEVDAEKANLGTEGLPLFEMVELQEGKIES
jgi:hypothetical protein